VFYDPLALSRYDPAHSGDEHRWITIGRAANGVVLLVVHTAMESTADVYRYSDHLGPKANKVRASQLSGEPIMNTDDNEEMRDEYDFSKAERGKFYRPDALVTIPVRLRLGPELLTFLSEKAGKKGVSLDELINDVLEK